MRNLRFDRERLMHLAFMGASYFPPPVGDRIPTRESVREEVEEREKQENTREVE